MRGGCNLRGLDLSGGNGRLLVVSGKFGCLGGNALKNVVDKGVQDGHGAVGDTSVRMNLFEDCGKDASAGPNCEGVLSC